MKMVSIQEMVERVRSLKPQDLTNWEQGFQATIERMALAEKVSDLSEAQLGVLENMYAKHFQ